MANDCAQGAFGRLAIKSGASPYTWSSGNHFPFFPPEGLVRQGQIVHPPVITGDLDEHAERARRDVNVYYGPITIPVSPGDLALLLPFCMYSTFSGTTITLGSTSSPFGVLIDRVTETFEYKDAIVDRWAVLAEKGEDPKSPPWVYLQIWVIATSDALATAWPAISLPTTAGFTPFVFSDLVATFGGTTREIKSLYIDVRYNVAARYVNSLNPTKLCPSRRNVRMRAVLPYHADNENLYDTALAGIAASLAFTNGTVSTTFSTSALQIPPKAPNIDGFKEIDLELDGVCRMTGSTSALTVVNDSTV